MRNFRIVIEFAKCFPYTLLHCLTKVG
uniref:Uncharacterized protein n=1 Tax=Rhizophora mucronata TaxID=61149 RepID=A0A2P2NXI0_RHIMU